MGHRVLPHRRWLRHQPTEVPVQIDNYPTIAAAIDRKAPDGNTPTRRALELATSYLETLTDPNPKYILLATDGQPNCNPDVMCPPGYMPTGTTCCMSCGQGCMRCMSTGADDDDGAVRAVAAAKARGFDTFVIGIAIDDAAVMTLDRMAEAGGQPRAGTPKHYRWPAPPSSKR